jgi:hypothetical protein
VPSCCCSSDTKANERVEFECKSKVQSGNLEIENKIKFKLSQSNRDGLKIKVEYEEETEMESGRCRLESFTSVLC